MTVCGFRQNYVLELFIDEQQCTQFICYYSTFLPDVVGEHRRWCLHRDDDRKPSRRPLRPPVVDQEIDPAVNFKIARY